MSKPVQTLVATASDGGTVTYRTRAGYDYAAIARGRDGWYLVAKGFAPQSVRSRARTALGSHAFELVPFKVTVKGVALSDVPPEMREHFDRKRQMSGRPAQPRQIPMITQAWFPGAGGFVEVTPRPATYSSIRELRGIGAETVAVVAYGSPLADFPIEPMLRRASLPLLGGGLIGGTQRKAR